MLKNKYEDFVELINFRIVLFKKQYLENKAYALQKKVKHLR